MSSHPAWATYEHCFQTSKTHPALECDVELIAALSEGNSLLLLCMLIYLFDEIKQGSEQVVPHQLRVDETGIVLRSSSQSWRFHNDFSHLENTIENTKVLTGKISVVASG